MLVSYTTNMLYISQLNVGWINLLHSHLFSRVFHANASRSILACWRRHFTASKRSRRSTTIPRKRSRRFPGGARWKSDTRFPRNLREPCGTELLQRVGIALRFRWFFRRVSSLSRSGPETYLQRYTPRYADLFLRHLNFREPSRRPT